VPHHLGMSLCVCGRHTIDDHDLTCGPCRLRELEAKVDRLLGEEGVAQKERDLAAGAEITRLKDRIIALEHAIEYAKSAFASEGRYALRSLAQHIPGGTGWGSGWPCWVRAEILRFAATYKPNT
jgi:hypothetical protein